jgi:hypothetical protein
MSILTNKVKEELFIELLKMDQEERHEYLCEVLPTYYSDDTVVEMPGKFIYCRGEIPVMLVAHLDTVHKQSVKTIIFDKERGLLYSPEGCGGDDTNGIWAILELLDRGLRPDVLFTHDEEVGGVGAYEFCQQWGDLEHINFMIQLDRRGNGQYVVYDLFNLAFEDYIQSFGFQEHFGSFSDISVLCPHFGIAGVNLSVSFFNEHTSSEYIDINGLEETIDRVNRILLDEEGVQVKYPYIERKANYLTGYEDTWLDKRQNECYEWCIACQSLVKKKDMMTAPYSEMCVDCYSKLDIPMVYCESCHREIINLENSFSVNNKILCRNCCDNMEYSEAYEAIYGF